MGCGKSSISISIEPSYQESLMTEEINLEELDDMLFMQSKMMESFCSHQMEMKQILEQCKQGIRKSNEPGAGEMPLGKIAILRPSPQ